MVEYLSSSQVANILGIHRVAVARIVRQGRLPAIKVANRWLIDRAVLDKFSREYIGKRGRPIGWRKVKEGEP